LGLEFRCFSLDDAPAVARHLADVDVVLHQAGPFSVTSEPMVDACLATGTHYLDVTGELDVFEAVYARHDEAVAAGVVLMPGVGFDVVPSDCLIAMVAAELPGATRLALAIHSHGKRPSAGTAKTMIEGLGKGGITRIEGRLRVVPAAYAAREPVFASGPKHAIAVPWGDLATAYRTTGIPNIECFMSMPARMHRPIEWMDRFRYVLAKPRVQAPLKRLVERFATGPDERMQANVRAEVWAEVMNDNDEFVRMTLSTPEPYRLTFDASVHAALAVLGGECEPGAHSPAGGLGAGFIDRLEGVEIHPPTRGHGRPEDPSWP